MKKASIRPLGAALLGLTIGVLPAVHAQDPAELDRLKTAVATMEKTIQDLKGRIQELERQQSRPAAPAPGVTEATPPPVAGPASATALEKTSRQPAKADLDDHASPMRHRETVSEDNLASPRPGNAPIDPTYAGFMPLFGSSTWIRLGGYAKVDGIFDSTRVGNPNKFVTAGIPVDGEADYGKDEEFNIHAKQTRLNFELRAPTPLGALRVVYENDFFGSSTSPDMAYNLRHFYGQVANLTVGQTWSAFADADANPDTLDMEGPGMQTMVRQPQLRYTYSPGKKHHHLAVAIEQPKSDLGLLPATASGRNMMPDLTGHWRWEGKAGHVQVGGLARGLAYDNDAGPDDEVFGWGANVSGVIHTWGQDGIVARFTYGDGLGRYMQDLPSGSAAVVLASGELATVPAWGAMFGYRHFWSEHWRSEVTYGYAELDALPEQGAKAYARTHYAQANLVWAATRNFFIGLEYLYGVRETQDGSEGDAHRVQMSLQYKLLR